MVGYNKVMLMGHLTRDPQLKTLSNETVVAEFGLACNRKYKGADGEEKQDTTFVDCSAFGRTAEVIGEWCAKGKPIFVEGRLKYDTWDDKNGGGKRSKLSIVVENFQFVGGREESDAKETSSGKGQEWMPKGDKAGGEKRGGRKPATAGAGFKQSDIPF